MRILLLGEYSNVHATLARGLRQLGHEVTVASNGDFWKNYPRDTDLERPNGRLGGLRLWLRVLRELPRWRGYDVVQLINPMFLELKAERIRPIYRYLRRHNRLVVLGAFGIDWYWVHECITRMPLRYSDFNIGRQLRTDDAARIYRDDWLTTPKGELNRLIAAECDLIVTGLYEYHVCYEPNFPEKTHFIPFPIEVPTNPLPTAPTTRLRLFIGINRERNAYKGTDIMLSAAEEVLRRHPDKMELIKVESVPFSEYQALMNGSDAILDQLYSYTPSMNPLLAMSKGIVCIGGGEPENYEIIGEKELRPIVNVEPTLESVIEKVEQLVLHPEILPRLKAESILYVRKHHDFMKVARQYEQLFKSALHST